MLLASGRASTMFASGQRTGAAPARRRTRSWSRFDSRPVPRQYRVRLKIIDVGVAARQSTGDARRLADGCCGPTSLVDADGPAARDSCPAPPVERARSFESALSPI